MAIIVLDPTVVKVSASGGRFSEGVAGVALAVGDWVYRDTSRRFQLADCTSAIKAAVVGVVMNNAVAGGTVYVNETETITTDAVLSKDTIYVISTTPGRIMPHADLVDDDFITIVGVAGTSTSLPIGIIATGIASGIITLSGTTSATEADDTGTASGLIVLLGTASATEADDAATS